jgi:hypothetical protein
MGIYVMVARTQASAVFYPGTGLDFDYVPKDGPTFNVRFYTTFDEAYDPPAPKYFCVEARGPGSSLRETGEKFANIALLFATIIALTVNADMGKLEPELIFDVTPGESEHEFLQSFVVGRPTDAVPGLPIDVDLVRAVAKAIEGHVDQSRLIRATAQYAEALASWGPGNEIKCLAHLYMGIEAVTRAVLREKLSRSGFTYDDELVAHWNLKVQEGRSVGNELEHEVRRRLIFQGDIECARKARTASDAFEHGFLDFDEIRKPAREVILRTAGYLRGAILNTTGIDPELLCRAFKSPYDLPRGPLRLVRYIEGMLIGQPEQLAAEGQLYPIFLWHSKLKSVSLNERGQYEFAPEEKLTALFGKDVQFRQKSFEVWDGGTIRTGSTHQVGQDLNVAHLVPSAKSEQEQA